MAWSYPIGGGALTFGPIVVDRTMYVTKAGSIVALDAATGKELWTHQGAPSKGMNYWESKDGKDKRLVYVTGGNLTQINAVTGATITSFGNNGIVDPTANSDRPVGRPGGNPGRIYENTVILALPGGANYPPGTTPGDVRAFDVSDRRSQVDVPQHPSRRASLAPTAGRPNILQQQVASTTGAR